MLSKENLQKSFGFIAIVVVVLFFVFYFNSPKKSEAPIMTDSSSNKIEEQNSNCGLTVLSPLVGAEVSFPLNISVVVDNTDNSLGCSWGVFEAQAGFVKVMNGTNQIGFGVLKTTEEWMTSSPVNYSTDISLDYVLAPGTALTLVFEEENPSGEGLSDTLSIPVVSNN